MTDNVKNSNSDEDAVLNELIRACRDKVSTEGLVRPDVDAITAYLMGTASKKQQKAVRSALAQSEQFRREILEMAQDMDVLAEIDLKACEEEALKIQAPERQKFLQTSEVNTKEKPEPESFWERLKTFWAKLWELKIPQIYAPAVVATMLVLVIVGTQWSVLFGPHEIKPIFAQWAMASENLETELLISNITRSVESEKHYGTPQEAALAEFRLLLKFGNGRFQLSPPKERPRPPSRYRPVLLQLVGSKDRIIREFRANIPITDAISSEPVVAWALGLPVKNLYKVEMESDIMAIKWTEDMGTYGCITFTYRDKEGYRAIVGFTFDLS